MTKENNAGTKKSNVHVFHLVSPLADIIQLGRLLPSEKMSPSLDSSCVDTTLSIWEALFTSPSLTYFTKQIFCVRLFTLTGVSDLLARRPQCC